MHKPKESVKQGQFIFVGVVIRLGPGIRKVRQETEQKASPEVIQTIGEAVAS